MRSPVSVSRRSAALAVAVVATAAAASPLLAQAGTTSSATSATTKLSGEVLHGLSAFPVLHQVSADTPMRIAVSLSYDKAARDAAYDAEFTKGSASYHAFYTPASFQAAFGADPAVSSRVERAITAHGLSVVYASPDKSYVELTGTTGQVEKTFQVTENLYQGTGGKTFVANAQAPTVPSGVGALSGLTSLTDKATAALPLAQDTCVPAGGTAGDLTAGPSGACLGVTKPSDLWSVYDQPSTDRGAGQKVAIFGEGKLSGVVSDLRLYEKTEKLPVVPVRQVLVGDNLQDDAGAGEWDLDSAATTGMAPDMQQLNYYFGSDLSDASIGGTYAAWANDPAGPMSGNSSFGGPEQLEYLGGFILDPILQQLAMEGRTMFASSGDVGGDCLPGANGVTNQGVPCVEYPASSTYTVGVGGTVLYTQTTDVSGATQVVPAKRADEYSWNYSGGGQSMFEKANPWEVAAYPGGIATPCTVTNTGDDCKGVPDVSAQSGDITTNGYEIVSGGAVTESGGTSLSSPLWAGMWARVLAAHPASCGTTYTGGKKSLGFAQEDLFNIANASAAMDAASFFDVGGLTDSMPSSNVQQQTLPRSPADVTGYDYVSGLGTPDISNISKALNCGSVTAVSKNVAVSNNDIIDNYSLTNGCPPNGILSDPAGDEIPALPALDLTKVKVSNDTKAITFSTTVSDLTASADSSYAFQFKYGTGFYAVTADNTPGGNTFSLYDLAVTVTPIGLGVIVNPTDLSDALTGSVTDNTISATMPIALFNSLSGAGKTLALGDQLSPIIIYSNTGPAANALQNDYNVEPTDQAEFFQCLYTLTKPAVATTPRKGSTPPKTSPGSGAGGGTGASGSLPTTGLDAVVPAAAVFLLAGGLFLLRRRSL